VVTYSLWSPSTISYAGPLGSLHALMSVVPALVVSAIVTLGLIARRRPPCLEIEPFPGGRRLGVAVALLVVVLALTAFLPLEGLFGDMVMPDPGSVQFFSLFIGHAVLAGFLLAWWALAGFEAPAKFFRLPTGHARRRLVLGLGAGFLVWIVTIGVMGVAATALGLDGGKLGEPESPDGIGNIPEVVRMIVALSPWRRALLVLSAGVFEEAFFRSFLQTRGGIVLSTVLFTMSHASYGLPFMLVGVFTVSLALGLLFRARGDVLPCMVAHSVFDAVQLFVVLPALVSAS
jgi:membrane protease YdiL (CAAX protease family)